MFDCITVICLEDNVSLIMFQFFWNFPLGQQAEKPYPTNHLDRHDNILINNTKFVFVTNKFGQVKLVQKSSFYL